MKPAYVSIEFWHKDRQNTATIEGWATTDFLETTHILVTPSIDYDDAIMKIAISWDKVISITPAESIREYRAKEVTKIGDRNKFIATDAHGGISEIDPDSDELKAAKTSYHERMARILFYG